MDERISEELRMMRDTIPNHVMSAITTPHEHESAKAHWPVWLVWMLGGHCGADWQLVEIASDEERAIRCAGEIFWAKRNDPSRDCRIERIPVNHRFASSIQTEVIKAKYGLRRSRGGHPYYRREGD